MSKKIVISLILILSVITVAKAQQTENEELRSTPIAYFDRYIGQWVLSESNPNYETVPDEIKNSVIFSFDWAGMKRMINMYEMHDLSETEKAVFVGLGAWNPVTNEISFVGSNTREDFYFEGQFTFEEENTLVREYNVFYPFENEWSTKIKRKAMKYRDIMTLVDEDTIEHQVQYFSVGQRKWLKFGGPDKYILEKVKS